MNTQSSLSPHHHIASGQSPPQPSPSKVYSSEEEITPRLPYKQSNPQNHSFSSSSYHPDTNLTRKRNASLDRSGSAKVKSPESSNFRPTRKRTKIDYRNSVTRDEVASSSSSEEEIIPPKFNKKQRSYQNTGFSSSPYRPETKPTRKRRSSPVSSVSQEERNPRSMRERIKTNYRNPDTQDEVASSSSSEEEIIPPKFNKKQRSYQNTGFSSPKPYRSKIKPDRKKNSNSPEEGSPETDISTESSSSHASDPTFTLKKIKKKKRILKVKKLIPPRTKPPDKH
jgi:hypothetical protein